MFTWLKKFINKIIKFFSKKNTCVHTEEIKEDTTVETHVDEAASDDAIEDTENTKEDEPAYDTISEDEKVIILDIIRPIIKDFNMDDNYKEFCENIAQVLPKKLKTFSTLNDDGSLTIHLTQSSTFNKAIAEFIQNKVSFEFNCKLCCGNDGYSVFSNNDGDITIRKNHVSNK